MKALHVSHEFSPSNYEVLENARERLLAEFPLFGREALAMPISPNESIDTACTDGLEIWFNQEFLAALSRGDPYVVLIHEVGHKLLRHMLRRGNRDPRLWAFAADEELNNTLVAAGLPMVEGALCSPEFKGMVAEDIYEILKQREEETTPVEPPEPPGGGSGENPEPGLSKPSKPKQSDPGEGTGEESGEGTGEGEDVSEETDSQVYVLPDPRTWGEVIDQPAEDGKEMTESDRAIAESVVSVDLESTLAATKLVGTTSIKLEKAIRGVIKESKVNWREEMSDFADEIPGATDGLGYTWSRPSRRGIGAGIYLPSNFREGVGEVALVLDSSGSMCEDRFNAATAEAADLINTVEPEVVHVIHTDSRVRKVEHYESGESMDLVMRVASGGTDFDDAFRWIRKNCEACVAIIVISDMELESSWYPKDLGIPTLWIDVGTRPWGLPDYGKVIKVRTEGVH